MPSLDLRSFAFSFLAYRPHVSPVQWAEGNLHLDARVTETPGPYSLRLHPFAREVLDTFGDNSTTDLTLCWCAQGGGKTTTISAGLLYRLLYGPTPALFVFPTKDLAQSFSETRLAPLLDSCDQLAALKPKGAGARSRFKKTEWQLDTCNVTFVGSNSPANLAGRPVGLLICDEVDKFKEADEKEAAAINLAEARTIAFSSAKKIYTSTPTTDAGEIWLRYLKGDQRRYFVPCPHCREFITLDWRQGEKGPYNVVWDETARDEKTEAWDYKRVLASAHYKCQKCGGKIEDHHKTRMLWDGKWIPTNPGALPGWKSYHLSGLYSASKTFGKLAMQWLQAQESISEIQHFVNSVLAEPWTDRAIKNTPQKLTPLLGTSERGQFDPADGGHNLMGVDVQMGYFAFVVRRFYAANRSHLVDWGMVANYEDLDTRQRLYSVEFVAIDSGQGERAGEVYRQCAQRAGSWFPVKGGAASEFCAWSQVDPYTGNKKSGEMKINLLHVSDAAFSDEILARIDGKIGGWKLTSEIDTIYEKQILAVYKSEKRRRNGTLKVEHKSRGAEHFFDCEKYLLALATILGVGPQIAPAVEEQSATVEAATTGSFEF